MAFLLKPLSFVLIIFTAYLLKRVGFFGEKDHQIVSRIVLNITLPCAVLHAFSGFECDLSLLALVPLGFVFALIPLLAVYFLTGKMAKTRRALTMVNAGGYNIGCFTLPVVQSFFGPAGAVIACMFDTGNAIMMTGGSYAITSSLLKTDAGEAKQTPKEAVLTVIKKFVTSVPFDTYMIMLLITLLGVKIPDFLLTLTAPVASSNSFFAMFMIGLMFTPAKNASYLRDTARILLIRLSFAAAFSLLIYWCLPFPLLVRQVLSVVVFAPVSALAPIYTEKCGGDGSLSSFANSISIFIGLIIMSVLVMAMGVGSV